MASAVEDTSAALPVPLVQKVKVYSMTTKDGIVQIIGSIGGKLVILRAKVCEMGSNAVGNIKQASSSAQAAVAAYVNNQTVVLQDGYVYVSSRVGGRVASVKAQVLSCTVALTESSKERIDPALQKLKPYYVKVQNGAADIVGTINGKIVVIRTKIGDRYASIQGWTLQSASAARAVVDGYTSYVLNKATCLRQGAAARVDHILVNFRAGAVHVKGVVGEHMLRLQAKLSDTAVFKQMLRGWQGILELKSKILQIVSNIYGKALDSLKVVQCSIKDNFVYFTCQVNERFVVVRVKIGDVADHLQSNSLELYAATKKRILNATVVARKRAANAGVNVRCLAANRDAQASAAGAVALGASGGVTGLFAGAAVGAVCALPAAFFTFGLSIPVGAAVGAGGGLCVGSSAGAVAGGVAGYKAHREKDSIEKVVSGAFEKAKARREKAIDSASNLRSHLADRIRGHTGGTAFA